MKKLLLILSIFVVSLSTIAADLNPFAYGLSSSVNALNPMQLDIQFSINAPATSVKVYLYEIDGDWEVEVDAHLTVDNRAYKGWIDLSVVPADLRGGTKNLNWRVDVNKGSARTKIEFASNEVKLDFPSSVDIDNNPENENFGTVFVVEALPTGLNNSKLISKNEGAGLYIINADGTARPVPNRVGQYGYNGGRVKQTRQYFNGTSSSGFSPYRVRVSDDGRIFISSMTIDGEVLWEADPLVFSRPNAADWETRAAKGWSHVMSALNANTVLGTARRNCSHTYCGIYHLYQGSASGPFIAGPNMGFDVRGSGADLKLLMLAGCKEAIVTPTSTHFYCDEYDLGEAKMWNTPPSRRIFKGYVVNYAGVQVQYDGDGNVWLCQHRYSADAETLMKFDVNDLDADPWKEDPKKTHHRCGAIRFNNDYTQVAIATIGSGYGGAFTVYPVEDGMPVWNQGTEVDCKSVTHHSLMDFAWDYAGNLYIAADEASGSAGDCVAIYATPYSGLKSTPAASRYAFEVNCVSDESYLINVTAGENQGSATITAGFDAEGKVPSCTPVEVFAQSKDDYKFVCWKEGDVEVSRENPYTFLAVKDITLTAHFEVGEYNVTWWNLFKNGEDIGKESTAYPGTNERLWRLYQIEYEKYNTSKSGASMRWHYDTHKPDGVSKAQFNVGTFVYYNTRGDYNRDFLTSSTTNTTTPFAWLGKYIESVTGTVSTNVPHWQYVIYLFFNRTNKAYNASEVDCTSNVTWTDNTKSFAKDYGMPEYWRPWWTEAVCNLEKTISSEKSMPVTWNQDITCAAGDVAKFGRFNGTAPTSNKETQPSLWYQWYTAPKSDQLLAWRDGGTTGRIVHHVYRDNMKLYATYVDAHLQENDPQPDLSNNPYDATNSDVLDLLANNKHASTPLNFTIDRKFVGGMYNTVCFPFDVYPNELPEGLKDAEILEFKGVTTSGEEFGESEMVLNFEPLTTTAYLEAGRAYLIKLEADVNEDLDFKGFQQWRFFDGEKSPREDDTFGGVTFQGVFSPTTLPENAYILVANNRLAKVTEGNEKMKGFRGYFTWDDPVRMPPAKMSISIGKQTPTAIEEITDPQPTEQPAAPKVRKVMYDGQIYILRGDEVYTITGHRVK